MLNGTQKQYVWIFPYKSYTSERYTSICAFVTESPNFYKKYTSTSYLNLTLTVKNSSRKKVG